MHAAPQEAPRAMQAADLARFSVAYSRHRGHFRWLPLNGNSEENQADTCPVLPRNGNAGYRAAPPKPHARPHVATFYRLPSGKWRAQIKAPGVRESASFGDRKAAVRWAADREAQLEHEATAGPERVKSLQDVLERYRDEISPSRRGARVERTRIDAMIRHYPGLVSVKLAALTPERLGQWRDERLLEVKRSTVTRYMTVITSALELARREWRWLKVNPMRDVKRPPGTPHRKRTLQWREIRRMLNTGGVRSRGRCRTATEAAARAMLFALRCGMRAGEICALEWSDVHTDYVHVRRQKSIEGQEDERDVPLSRAARRALQGMKGWDSPKVFGLRSQTLDALFRKLRDRAGLSGFTFHDTRHTAATMISRKVDVLTLCKIFGWKDLKRSLTYYNPTASEIAKRL